MTYKYVDLFAGIGGFAAALNSTGGELALAVEFDKKAAATYKLNFAHNSLGDVREIAKKAEQVPDHHVLTGGFPCQPFSKSGAQRGTNEERGNLFDEIMTIIETKKPRVIVLENVRNLAGPRHVIEWQRIILSLRGAGYRVSSEPALFSPHLLPREQGGRPQHRVRLFITATYNPNAEGSNAEEPDPVVGLTETSSIHWDLANDLPLDVNEPSGTISAAEIRWLNAWQDWVTQYRRDVGSKLPGFPIWSDYWVEARPSDYEQMPPWKKLIVDKNIELFLSTERFTSPWLEKWSIRGDFPSSRRKLEWQAGDLPSIWECLVQLRPSGIRVKRPNYVPTLVALSQTPIYGPQRRRLSERELARLQGFPDGYDFGAQDAKVTAKQLGNAVNVGVIVYVLRRHCERDRDVLSTSDEGRTILNSVLANNLSPDSIFRSWGGAVVSAGNDL